MASLGQLTRPLALTFIGIVLLSLGVAYLALAWYHSVTLPPYFYYLLLQFLPTWVRGLLFCVLGAGVLGVGLWRLSGIAVISLEATPGTADLVLGYERTRQAPRMAVVSGGAGMLILASLGRRTTSLICITPVQDPVEYYYRASSLLNFEHVVFVAPTPHPIGIQVRLDDGQLFDINHNISHEELLAPRHVEWIGLQGEPAPVTRMTLDAIRAADVLILGPGSLFESILPSLLLPDVQHAIQESAARKIYICSLMTEPGLTTGFGVADHIRQFQRFAGFTPDYVLVNAQRIDPDVRRIYAAANQAPVYLTPEEYEETVVSASERETKRDVSLEGAIVIEGDLASSVVQLTASLDNPSESRTVRVLRHDPEKLATAIAEILRRG
jgi:uncharacterized cofD-like protein